MIQPDMTYRITTLGCKVNQYESEKIAAGLERLGLRRAGDGQAAGVVVINSCTVTTMADRKSRHIAHQAVRDEGALVFMTGCGAEQIAGESSEQAEEDSNRPVVVTNAEKSRLPELVAQTLGLEACFTDSTGLEDVRTRFHTRALAKVQDGCDQFCSYCVVPYVRGAPKSRPLGEIVEEIKRLVDGGTREVVLTGVHLGKYGLDFEQPSNLLTLLEEVLKLEGLGRVRLSSIEALEVSDELVQLLSGTDGVCRHLHIPLQSGNNKVLSEMRRGYAVEEYLERITQIRAAVPEIALTTDVMVGFPGETDEEFEDTRLAVKEAGFSKLHVFKFSPRPDTPAAGFPSQLDAETKNRRSSQLIADGEKLRNAYVSRFVGRKLQVLVEKEKVGSLTGMSDNYIRVNFSGPSRIQGRIVEVEAVRKEGNALWGKLKEVF